MTDQIQEFPKYIGALGGRDLIAADRVEEARYRAMLAGNAAGQAAGPAPGEVQSALPTAVPTTPTPAPDTTNTGLGSLFDGRAGTTDPYLGGPGGRNPLEGAELPPPAKPRKPRGAADVDPIPGPGPGASARTDVTVASSA